MSTSYFRNTRLLSAVSLLALVAACSNTGQQNPPGAAGDSGQPGSLNGSDISGGAYGDDVYGAAIDSLDSAYDTRIGDYVYDAKATATAPTSQGGFVNNAPARTPGFVPASADGRVIYFDLDSTRLQPETLPIIQQHAQRIKSTGARVVLYGHTDKRGSSAYNMSLGERRNISVARALASYGVAASQISTVSYGEERPAVPGNYAKNRRVEIKY